VTKNNLSDIYRAYIACLNQQDWPKLGQFVDENVARNGQRLGLSGYRRMLETDFHEIPDLRFNIQLLIADPPYVASRLAFDCSPKENFLGLQRQREESVLHRERLLRISSGKDRAGMVGHRQGGDRNSTLGAPETAALDLHHCGGRTALSGVQIRYRL